MAEPVATTMEQTTQVVQPETKQAEKKAKRVKPTETPIVKTEMPKPTSEEPAPIIIEQKAALTEAEKLARIKQKEAEKRRLKFAHLKLFNKWSTDFEVRDLGLKPYLNISPMVVPYSAGRNIKKQFWKSKKSIVERLILKLMATGHKGKKHYWTTRSQTGMLATQYNIIKRTLEIIEQKSKKNPVEVLVRAFEVGSPREGVATIEYGGVRYPKAADMSPQRRIDLCLRWMTQGAFNASRKNKRHVWDALADEIIATSNNDATKSNCLTKRTDLERQAGGSR